VFTSKYFIQSPKFPMTRCRTLHALTYITAALRKDLSKSNFAQAGIEYTFIGNNKCKDVQLKSELQNTKMFSAAALPPRCLCYRPAVLFRHIRLIALSLFQKKSVCLKYYCN